MTAPLTPPDCDLRAMTFMPIDIIRLFGSEFHALSSDAEWRAGLTLWLKAWHQVPAASLPDDDVQLARHAELGRDLKTWKKVRTGALRGWIKCEDGRLYHPVVADKAMDAWMRRSEWQEREENRTSRQQRWRERCKAISEQLRERGVTPPRGASLETLERLLEETCVDGSASTTSSTQPSHVDGVEIGKTGTGTGTSSSEDKSSASDPPEDFDATAWQTAVAVLTKQGEMAEPAARRFFGKLLAQHKLLARDMLPSVAGAMVNRTQEPQAYLTRAAAGVARRRTASAEPARVGWV